MISDMFDVLDAMDRFGGSFVKQLAVLYRLADSINQKKLEDTFSNYFEEYTKMSEDLIKGK
jgi:hypothetical protein